MINNLQISNFKSIKNIELLCNKINVFIGEPNSGKSNIIEALSLQSQNAFDSNSINKSMFRYKTLGNLFYDFNINKPIVVKTNECQSTLKFAIRDNNVHENVFHFIMDTNDPSQVNQPMVLKHDGTIINHLYAMAKTNIHFYEFKRLEKFTNGYTSHLTVPNGENIPLLLLSNPALRQWVSDLFRSFGYRLTLNPIEGEITMSKDVNDDLYSYPYFAISETIQRLIFYSLAIKSNKNNVLLFDEPESNMFPFYIKDFGERIAEEDTNQFFITTHNPYLLGSLLDKTESQNINIFITKMKNFETTVTLCSDEQKQELLSLGSGSFLSLDNILNDTN